MLEERKRLSSQARDECILSSWWAGLVLVVILGLLLWYAWSSTL